MQDLASLIEEVKEANNWTDSQIAQRAKSAGHHLTGPNISRMAREPILSLKPGPMIALAAGLDVPLETVIRAGLVSLGIPLKNSGDMTLERAIRIDPGLSQSQRRSLLALLGTFRETTADELIEQYGLAARRGPKDD